MLIGSVPFTAIHNADAEAQGPIQPIRRFHPIVIFARIRERTVEGQLEPGIAEYDGDRAVLKIDRRQFDGVCLDLSLRVQ